MNLQIVNDKKLSWNYVKKVVIKLTTETLNYEEPLRVEDLIRLHFVTGTLLAEYYSQEKK